VVVVWKVKKFLDFFSIVKVNKTVPSVKVGGETGAKENTSEIVLSTCGNI
jgi:hypothetical protein